MESFKKLEEVCSLDSWTKAFVKVNHKTGKVRECAQHMPLFMVLLCISQRIVLNEALEMGILKDNRLPEMLTELRNPAAHESPMNANWSVPILCMSAEVINQLFDRR